MFEKATRKKLRFDSSKGGLSVEDLWDLSLTSKDGCDLDTVAKTCSKKLKEVQEESFVKPVPVATSEFELKLEIVKFIIAVKLAEKAEKEAAADKAAKKQKLKEAINRKQDEIIGSKTLEQLQAELDSL